MINTVERTTDRRGLSVREAAQYLGIGTTSLYKLIRQGRVRIIKLGSRTIVPRAEIERVLNGGA